MVALTIVLRVSLPVVRPTTDLSYPALLRSVARLVLEQPTLACASSTARCRWVSSACCRRRSLPARGQALPLHRGDDRPVRAGSASAERSSRRSPGEWPTTDATTCPRGCSSGLMLVSWAAIAAGRLVAGGADRRHRRARPWRAGGAVTSQSVIYALNPAARSRLTTAYMTTVFASAAASSAVASAIYDCRRVGRRVDARRRDARRGWSRRVGRRAGGATAARASPR